MWSQKLTLGSFWLLDDVDGGDDVFSDCESDGDDCDGDVRKTFS